MSAKIVISEENEEFLARVTEISDQVITRCDQCITPSQMMRMVQLGQSEVLKTKALWFCASCFTCTVRCPRGLDLSRVAEALRQIVLRQAVDHIKISEIPRDELVSLPQIALVAGMRKFTA
jgi:heterodisulfide reductase subunit C